MRVSISSSRRGLAWQYRTPSSSTVSGSVRRARAPARRRARAASARAVIRRRRRGRARRADGLGHLALAVAAHPVHGALSAASRSSVAPANGPGHGVAADQRRRRARRARIGEHRLERVDVAVDVVEREDVPNRAGHAAGAPEDDVRGGAGAVRPRSAGYPPQIFDDLAALAQLPAQARLVEIGCGTGQATVPLAERGYAITCVELGERLAATARRKLAAFPSVSVINADFETWQPERPGFDAVVAFSAFHWLAPDRRYTKTADLLGRAREARLRLDGTRSAGRRRSVLPRRPGRLRRRHAGRSETKATAPSTHRRGGCRSRMRSPITATRS